MSDAKEMAYKYIKSVERVLNELRILVHGSINIDEGIVRDLLDNVRSYFDDAQYYFNEGKFEVGLASIAYCEGLLDALRLLKIVEFSW